MSPKFAKNLGRLAKAFTIKPPWPARIPTFEMPTKTLFSAKNLPDFQYVAAIQKLCELVGKIA